MRLPPPPGRAPGAHLGGGGRRAACPSTGSRTSTRPRCPPDRGLVGRAAPEAPAALPRPRPCPTRSSGRCGSASPTGPALVLGSTQRARSSTHAACAAAGIEVVRRRSGGGAVLVEPGRVLWVDVLAARPATRSGPTTSPGPSSGSGEAWAGRAGRRSASRRRSTRAGSCTHAVVPAWCASPASGTGEVVDADGAQARRPRPSAAPGPAPASSAPALASLGSRARARSASLALSPAERAAGRRRAPRRSAPRASAVAPRAPSSTRSCPPALP